VAALVAEALRGAFRGRRVLVTGDTGFKGSWLALALSELGADVAGFALPPEHAEGHYMAAGIGQLVAHHDGDLRDPTAFVTVARRVEPEVVFHLAAQPLVRRSYAEPRVTFDTNVGGSVNVLETVRCAPSVRALVYVTSDKCYRNKEWEWGYRENDELGGDDPYSASKAAAELVFASYAASFFRDRPRFGAATVRAGNVIGGGDWSTDRIVPDCIRAVRRGDPIVLRNPSATRPWQHVLEPVMAYLLIGQRLLEVPERFRGAWNFGPRAEATRTVHELAQEVVRLWGSGSVRVDRPANAPHEAGLLQLNCDKARQLLGWQAVWDFETAIGETVRWYRETAHGTPALDVSRQQIARYLEDARS
jgi:CDP-glucose 4,6-dehydratase